ncbi:hypothetical protein [Pseudomonas sp. EL_65y_Pfl2_R95]|uniref:hypothetical protein n=1 Tax=Pseudomonas sp. EL_65y_Pfl2_R95 TaxID=3088698 RepID=UPI0030D8B7B3
MSMSLENPGYDIGFIGQYVCIYHDKIDFPVRFPAVTSTSLALDLAEMLRKAMPRSYISVEPIALFSTDRVETDAVTERIKRRVIEARKAENPGKAFLQGIGYWPQAAQTGKE